MPSSSPWRARCPLSERARTAACQLPSAACKACQPLQRLLGSFEDAAPQPELCPRCLLCSPPLQGAVAPPAPGHQPAGRHCGLGGAGASRGRCRRLCRRPQQQQLQRRGRQPARGRRGRAAVVAKAGGRPHAHADGPLGRAEGGRGRGAGGRPAERGPHGAQCARRRPCMPLHARRLHCSCSHAAGAGRELPPLCPSMPPPWLFLQELFPASFAQLVRVYNHMAVDQLIVKYARLLTVAVAVACSLAGVRCPSGSRRQAATPDFSPSDCRLTPNALLRSGMTWPPPHATAPPSPSRA